jgi:hypothetical protein
MRRTLHPMVGAPFRRIARAAVWANAALGMNPATAQERDIVPRDRYEISARGETHALLFRRTLLPGRTDVLAVTDTVTPVRQDIRLRVRDLDTAWRPDSLDLDVAAWALWSPGEPLQERALDGDIQTANVGYRHGPVLVRLGRQNATGGAARYARFDGIAASVQAGSFFVVDAYGGLTVLPRWNGRVGYHYLGAAADSNLRAPDAVPEMSARIFSPMSP